MRHQLLNGLGHPHLWLIIGFLIIFGLRVSSINELSDRLKPQGIYSLTVNMNFEQEDEEVNIETYIPVDSERQTVIKESTAANGLGYLVREDNEGRVAQWNGLSNSNGVQYKAILATRGVSYEIKPEVNISKQYPESLLPFLMETDSIQVSHPEILSLWQSIQPEEKTKVRPVLKAIYDFTYEEIEGAPFKGLTDAITALRLKLASCNGKSRLFIALARLNNIPARLVGGIILNKGSKKTSHQWVEVYVQGHWIPFGPTNGNFASLPENYLTLYKTDQVLFRHSVDINFDYLFSINQRLVAPSLYQVDLDSNLQNSDYGLNVTRLLVSMGLDPQVVGLFLLFPVCTLLISFLRNIIGVKTFGIFMPMLIAAACVFTGFFKGIIAFIVILLVSFITYLILDRMRLLKVARLAAIITVNTLFILIGLSFIGTGSRIEFGMLALFPVVIISFIAERIHDLSSNSDWFELGMISFGTLVSIWFCYLILGSFLLEGLFSFYPEFYLLILAAQIYIGRWTGLRLTELHRFRDILKDKGFPVLGINGRNRELIYRLNKKNILHLAADKLKSKKALRNNGIVVPQTLLFIDSLSRLNDVDALLESESRFVLKPNMGSRGSGIIVFVDKKDSNFITASGKSYTRKMIRQHCIDIITGSFAQSGETDIAYFEPLLIQHCTLQNLASYGLSDIRVIVAQGKVVSAMLRMPTSSSDGKANLHQGAVGVAVDILTGMTLTARHKQKAVTKHPDSGNQLIDVQIPFWSQIIEMSLLCQKAIDLGYMGVDICIDEKLGPLVLEVNGRPGIEIQNVQNRGFYHEFQY